MPRRTLDTYGYARQVLLPSLGLQNHPFAVHLPEPGGTASHVVKLTIERAPALLVRFFKGRGRARRSALALQHLEHLDLPAPRLKWTDTNPVNPLFRRNGQPRYATVETWIDGIRSGEAEDEEEAAFMVARVLARYHSVSRSRWGRPEGLPEVRPYHVFILSLASRMVRDLAARGVLQPEDISKAHSRFVAWKGSLMKLGTFHLVHNDASKCNFIIAGAKKKKEVFPIDVQRISYEPCAEEIANAMYHFTRNNSSLAAKFLHAYLEAATPSCRETWDRTGAFFTALNNLKRLHRRTGPSPGSEPLVASDQRLAEWRSTILNLSPPPKVWPEPGSAPPQPQ
jgi:Ser/Thr protein kinase RdoA (MazF antagonist)